MMNIRIVQFLICSDAWEDLYANDKGLSSYLGRRATWSSRGDNYASEPMLNTSREYNEIASALESDKLKHEVMDISEDYDLYVTSAPGAFDYEYHFVVATLSSGERLLALQRERAEYQIGRNSSGLHYTRKVK